MGKTFNELFNDFFKRNTPKSTDDGLPQAIKDEVTRIIETLNNFKEGSSIDESIEFEIDKTLGKPDKTEFYTENGLFYEKRIWHTPNGDMVKLMVTDDPSLLIAPPEPKSLKVKLEEAVAEEDYEKAAIIRDEIKKTKKKKK